MQWRALAWLTVYGRDGPGRVEAALVIHLRTIYYAGNPLVLFPVAVLSARDLSIELLREVATVLMILSVASLASQRGMQVFAAFIYVFGLWDIWSFFVPGCLLMAAGLAIVCSGAPPAA